MRFWKRRVVSWAWGRERAGIKGRERREVGRRNRLQEDDEFMVILSYIMSWRLAWDTRPCLKPN